MCVSLLYKTNYALEPFQLSPWMPFSDEVKRLAVYRREFVRPLDLEKDRSAFKQWNDQWTMHLHAHRIYLNNNAEERWECCLIELTVSLSNQTLKLIANQDYHQGLQRPHIRVYQPHRDGCRVIYDEAAPTLDSGPSQCRNEWETQIGRFQL
jgi:hypothetical protein